MGRGYDLCPNSCKSPDSSQYHGPIGNIFSFRARNSGASVSNSQGFSSTQAYLASFIIICSEPTITRLSSSLLTIRAVTCIIDHMYSVKEASSKIGISDSHLRRLLESGQIKGKKLGHDWVVLSLDYKRKRIPKGGQSNEKS